MGKNTEPRCSCIGCNRIGVYAHQVRNRGGGNAYLCADHERELASYYRENTERMGTEKAHGYTFSIELECMRPTPTARIELCIKRYLPTHDGTVDAEFKSPIYNGTPAIKSFLPSIQWLIDSGNMVIDDNCGTHFHVGQKTYITPFYMGYIRRYYHSLFVPLSDAMRVNRAKVEYIFGRNLCGWASAVTAASNEMNHSNYLNVEHDFTLEWRLCFFKSAEQYARAVDFCRAATEIVVNDFCKTVEKMHLTDGQRLSDAQRQKLKSAADKAGRKIAAMFDSDF